jgi:tripartite-type tricarboxylate transporter receptor subunit TctC
MESGQMRPLVLAMNQRHPGWPNVPITKELGFNIVLPMLRGIAIKKGADPAIRKVLEDAFMKGAASDAYKNFMISKKLDPKAGLLNSQDFTKFIQENYLFVKTLIKETGYLVK